MSETNEKPAEQRPELPDFWDKRFATGVTPWDAGRVPEHFSRYVAQQNHPLTTLIPGCGSAWEAAHLAARGWLVTALDFSAEAQVMARKVLEGAACELGGAPGQVDLIQNDFFTFQPKVSFELIYERAFLCSLPRKTWVAWGRRLGELLPQGGLLVGYFFISDQLKGPPFGISREGLDALLGGNFDRLEDLPVSDSLPIFAGCERWQVWRRR